MTGSHHVSFSPRVDDFIDERERLHPGFRLACDTARQQLEAADLNGHRGRGRRTFCYAPRVDTLVFTVLLRFEVDATSPYATIVGVGSPSIGPPQRFEE